VTDATRAPTDAPHAPRGWYPDPQQPARERWWTGAEWSSFTHRTPGPLTIDPRYTRSYWIGSNGDAGRARIFTEVAGILLLAVVVVACLIGARFVAGAVWAWIVLGMLVVSAVIHVGGIVFGRRGLRHADALGARGASISSIVVSSIELVVCLCGILVTAVLLALAAR
jgi:hypothetical protein